MNVKKVLYITLAGLTALSLFGCSKGTSIEEPSIEASQEPQTNEDITAMGIELVTGLLTKLEGNTVSTNGVWMTEAQVGQVAKTFTSELYKCERKSLKESQVKFVSILYNIDNEIACSIYFDENMNMYYNNKYLIVAPDIKTLYKEVSENITIGSILEFPTANSNSTSGNNDNIANSNNDLSISTAMLQSNIGFDEQTAKILAESMAKVGVPTIMKAEMAANSVIRTFDINNNSYLIAIQDGAILYIFNEGTIMYMYAADGYDTRVIPDVQSPQPQTPSQIETPSEDVTLIDPTQPTDITSQTQEERGDNPDTIQP